MVKYLVVYGINIAVYSFNELLGWYAYLVDNRVEDKRVNTFDEIRDLKDAGLQMNLLKAYRKRDEDKLKELLFGKRCKDEVKLYYEKADIGILNNGSIITVEHENDVIQLPNVRVVEHDRHLQYGGKPRSSEDKYTNIVLKYSSTGISLGDNEIEKLEIKMALANKRLKAYKYDSGWVSLEDTFINLEKHIHIQDFAIKNKNMLNLHDISMLGMVLFEIDNFSINHLITSTIRKIDRCKGRINHMMLVWIYNIVDSEIVVDNIANVAIGIVESSHLIFNESVYRLHIYRFEGATLEFNCDIDRDSLSFVNKTFEKCTLIFRRKVGLETLLQIWDVCKISSIQVNPDIYNECKQDKRFKNINLGVVNEGLA